MQYTVYSIQNIRLPLHFSLSYYYTQDMITLANSAREARLLLKYGSVIIGVAIILILIFRFGAFLKNIYFPTPPEPPQMGFGVLPQLPLQATEGFSPSFRINTQTGFLPVFPDRIPVYTLIQPDTNILTVQRIRSQLSNAGFSLKERKLSDTVYEWYSTANPDTYITYDIITKNFDISSNYANNSFVLTASNLPTGAQAVQKVFDFLRLIGKDVEDLEFNRSIVSYYRIVEGDFVKSDVETAQVTKVALFLKAIENVPIEYNYNTDSDMVFFVASADKGSEIIHATYKETDINYENSSTYPLKTAEQAFQDLQQGNARILDLQTPDFVDIFKVYPAYYVGEENKDFLLPIIVFEGKGFKAYVNAIPTTLPQVSQ